MVSHCLEVVSCIVPGCENTNVLSPDKSFFVISGNEERCHHWLLVCNREDLLEHSSAHCDFAVCSDHFVNDHFEDKAHTKLKDDAVPAILPSLEEVPNFNANDEDRVVLIKSEYVPFIVCDDVNQQESTETNKSQNMQYLCRLCANVAEEMVYLFNSSGQDMHLARKINASLPVTIQDTDPLPKQLCSVCVVKVNMCHEFAEMCLIAEEKLISLMKNNAFRAHRIGGNIRTVPGIVSSELGHNFSSITVVDGGADFNSEQKDENYDASMGTYNQNHSSVGVLQENEEFDKDPSLFSCPLCPEGIVSTKENEICNDLGEGSHENDTIAVASQAELEQENCIHSSSNDEISKMNLAKSKFKHAVPKHSTEVVSRKEENGESCKFSSSKTASVSVKKESSKKSRLSNQIEIVDCCICKQSFNTLELCLNHSKAHFSATNFPCTVCNKEFVNENDHVHHCRLHTAAAKQISHNGKRLKCDFCERKFNNQRTFLNHNCSNSEPKQFRCNFCKKSYSTLERLIFHKKFHEGARPNFCEQCEKEFDNEGSLYYHIRMVHIGERPFSCSTCGKKFYSNSRLITHKRVHTGERPFECEVCGRRFYDRETLKGHYVTHMAVKPFQCDFCGVCWGRKSLLNQHIRTHHTADSNSARRVPSLIHYYCKICDTTFTNSTDVLMHRTTHWKTKSDGQADSSSHTCEYCGESFCLVASLVKHRKLKHPDEKPFVCSICNTHSHTLYEARVHRNKHSGSKEEKTEEKLQTTSSFVCEACGNIFTEKRRFMRHMREHRATQAYKCHVCGKQFIDNQRLTVHMRLHTGEKPYTCSVCGKRFSQTSALYTHALLHTGEKPHACDLCGKAFRIKADRDNHRRSHTGEKPYKCEFCNKTFRTGQVYYQHRMIHTGERRFPCNICGKAFKRSHTLVVHKRIHTGEKPNICDICGKGFRQRSDMRKHRQLHGTATAATA